MANSRLTPGDTFISGTGEAYTYIGFYEGTPNSMYVVPQSGYLYMFIDNINFRKVITEDMVINNIIKRTRFGFDGNARYTKRHKQFVEKILHVDITHINLGWVYGIRRLGDIKPKGYTC